MEWGICSVVTKKNFVDLQMPPFRGSLADGGRIKQKGRNRCEKTCYKKKSPNDKLQSSQLYLQKATLPIKEIFKMIRREKMRLMLEPWANSNKIIRLVFVYRSKTVESFLSRSTQDLSIIRKFCLALSTNISQFSTCPRNKPRCLPTGAFSYRCNEVHWEDKYFIENLLIKKKIKNLF